METIVTRELYEAFLQQLSRRIAHINYDPEYDILYVAGDIAWAPTMAEKPRTFAVASGIQIDVIRSSQRVFGAEIVDFGKELRQHGDSALVAWWTNIVDRRATEAEGQVLARAMQQASYV